AKEQRGVSGKSTQHAKNAVERHAREKSEEGEARHVLGEESHFGRHAHDRAVSHRAGSSLERPADRLPPQGEDHFPGRLLAARAGSTGQRPRQSPGADSREAQSGLRSLYQRAYLRRSTDESG